jgi:hypothetical protein
MRRFECRSQCLQGIKANSIVALPDGDEHARLRKHLSRFFNSDNVAAVVGRLGTETNGLVDGVVAAAASGAPPPRGGLPPGVVLDNGAENGKGGASATDGVRVDAFQMAAMNLLRVVFLVRLWSEVACVAC